MTTSAFEVPIQYIPSYIGGMQRSLHDKLWWLSSGVFPDNITSIIDYGCADGYLLRKVHKEHPELNLYGYDSSPEMIKLAREKSSRNDVIYTDDMDSLSVDKSKTMIIASSVFHEIEAYSEDPEKDRALIFNGGFKYIAIRDMFLRRGSLGVTNPEDVDKIRKSFSGADDSDRLAQFEGIYGPIEYKNSFLQFLLKYRYVENWDREVHENYFPYTLEAFFTRIPTQYDVVYFESYTLPFLKKKVREDFGIELNDPTHAKILLRCRN